MNTLLGTRLVPHAPTVPTIPTAPPVAAAENKSPISLGFVLYVLRRRWRLALLLGMLFAAAAVVAVWLVFVPMYRAEAWLKILKEDPTLVTHIKVEDSGLFVATQLELIRSPLVVGQILSRPEIAQLPEIQAQTDPKGWIRENLQVKGVGRSELFSVGFDAEDPHSSKKVVDAIIEVYLDIYNDQTERDTQRIVNILEEERTRQMEEVKRLERRIHTLARESAEQNAAVIPGAEGGVTVGLNGTLNALYSSLVDAQIQRELLKAELLSTRPPPRNVSLSPYELNEAVKAHPEFRQLQEEVLEMESQLRTLSREPLWKPGTKKHEEFQQEIADRQKQLAETEAELREQLSTRSADSIQRDYQRTVASLKAELQEAEVREQELLKRIAEERRKLESQAGKKFEIEFTQKELGRAQEVEQAISDRMRWLRVEKMSQQRPARVRLLQAAELPKQPVEDGPWKKMLLFGGAAFFLPLGLFGAWEFVIGRVYDAENLQESTHLHMVGEVSALPERSSLGSSLSQRKFERKQAVFYESVEQLRTSLCLNDSINCLKSLVITSSINGEGKTSLAAHLGSSWARTGAERIVLIDCDLRLPDLHHRFGVELSPGLADVLAGTAELEDVLHQWDDSLWIIPAGITQASVIELFSQGGLQRLVSELSEQFDRVIIDAPPVLLAAETLHVARAAEGVLFCARRDYSRTDQIKRACERLQQAGARTAGLILNGTPAATYSYRYGNYQHQGPVGFPTH